MFGKKTVDGVMSGFNKVIKDLEEVFSVHMDEALKEEGLIEEATDRRAAAVSEANRASQILAKLQSLVSA